MSDEKKGPLIGTGRPTCPDFPERVAHGVQGRMWADQWRREDEKRKGGKS